MTRVLHVVRPGVRLPDGMPAAGDVVVYAGWSPDPAMPRLDPSTRDGAAGRAPGAMSGDASGVAPAAAIEAYIWDDTTPPASVRDRAGGAGDADVRPRDDPQPPSIDAATVCDLAFALDLVIVW